MRVRGNEIEEVENFTYLGANVTKDGGGAVDVRRRIALASAQFKRISNIWQASNISRKIKVSLFKSLVMSVLVYGCETWKLTKGEEEKLDTFQNKCLRKILKVRWQQHISNATVLEAAEMDRVSEEVRRKRWSWIGHVLRKDQRDDCAVTLGWTPDGRRKRGIPKTNWRRMVEVERNSAGWGTWNLACQAAADQQQWKNVRALCASWHREN